MGFAVVAAHASAITDAFTIPAWNEAMNTISAENGMGAASDTVLVASPQEAAAHVVYLAPLISRGDGVASATSGEPVIRRNDLQDAGYRDLLPTGSNQAAAPGEPDAPNEASPLPPIQGRPDLDRGTNQKSDWR